MPIADKRVAQALQKDHLPVVVAFRSGFAGCDLGAVPDLPADDFQPGKRGLLDDGFSEGSHEVGLCRDTLK